MNRGIYSAASGMIATQRAMDVTSNNLANASTVGFKQDDLAFNDFYTRELQVQGRRIGSMGSGAGVMQEYTDRDQGRLAQTGNPLDFAIKGEGMFAVQTPAGVQYTRDGEFSLDPQKRLVDRDDNPVLDASGQVITLDGDGPVTVSKSGEIAQDNRTVANVGVWRGTMEKGGDNRFTCTNPQAIATPTMAQGYLEQSNVQPITAMIDMMRFGRHFEMSQKMIQTQDETTGKVIEVLRN